MKFYTLFFLLLFLFYSPANVFAGDGDKKIDTALVPDDKSEDEPEVLDCIINEHSRSYIVPGQTYHFGGGGGIGVVGCNCITYGVIGGGSTYVSDSWMEKKVSGFEMKDCPPAKKENEDEV